ncbi:GPI ethanolamine phosphate transferase 1-like isoform X2 [Phymastichus coffea]|nr:GPI ethanolamine phosphate transferase 1-like isoform X2 [Phymastichus coffea]
MPTESRPGNIAIVAGLYEDPSAIFKGWKENPVDFDTVFNQSRSSWLWGSPDIISLFTKGGNSNIRAGSYPAAWQNFVKETNSAKRLDNWVFEQYSQWLKTEGPIYKTNDKIVLYFHLLGCDTIGHASKPQSKDYVEVMMEVDRNIKKVVRETERYFGNGTTAYIFTADHGMTDWGSHGSGSTDETETPFVAWGAGIKKGPLYHNIEQADVTPLISTLIGISIPVNNEGILPYELLDLKYENFISQAFLKNAQQLAEQVKANRELTVGQSLVNMYSKDEEFKMKLTNAENSLEISDNQQFLKECKSITRLAKEVITYYRRYQTDRFLFCLMLMWVGWIILLYTHIGGIPGKDIPFGPITWLTLANISLVVCMIPLTIEYAVTGCKEWRLLGYGIIGAVSVWLASRSIIIHIMPPISLIYKPWYEVIGTIIMIPTMLAGLSYRWAFSISVLLAVILEKKIFSKNAKTTFIFTGATLAVFPLLPVVGPEPKVYIVLLALGISLIAIINKKSIYRYIKAIEISRLVLTSLLCLNIIDGRSFFSWFLMFSTPFVIWLHPKDWEQRIFGVTIALMSPLALLSASYEPLFFLIFASHLQYWPIYEYSFKSKGGPQILRLRDVSTAAFLMLYTLLSFFGTGNMASISSFDPSWTRHFLTVFSPFTMTTLILLKTVIPLILVGCIIRTLAKDSTIFCAVLLLGDCLALPLMYRVVSVGSWLDIGSSISRFVIAIVLPCLLVLVYYMSKPFTTFSLQEFLGYKSIKSQRLKI